MHLLDWPFLDALQLGALMALFVGFGTDAMARRDRMMGWLALTCFLVGLRHAVLALGTLPTSNPELVDRTQSMLVTLGFITLCAAVAELFPRQVPRTFPAWVALAMVPSYVRNLLLPHPGFWDTWLHHWVNLVYLVVCGFILHWTLKARMEGDPMGRRLFLGFVGVTLPVVVEVTALSLFDLKIRLSGFSLVILAMAVGTSWQWMALQAMETRIHRAETELEAWRSLVPGSTFRTDRPAPEMDDLFGPGWLGRLAGTGDTPLVGLDGLAYRVRTRAWRNHLLGTCERDMGQRPGVQGFLSGWTVGLGVDDEAERHRIRGLLEAWGAEVQLWGTVPPREGPYPSLLIWAREPSILAVWREDDLLRRRPRWIQVGGPATEGPHARLATGATREALRQRLESLLSRG